MRLVVRINHFGDSRASAITVTEADLALLFRSSEEF
jgi:hypothetical protein